jgi:threonylcarbamoyladenosine tRNA methylthiotransferase MtaB
MPDLTRIAIATLGCRVNFFDTQLIEEGLDPARYRQVSFEDEAEIYLINTCTVTASADAQARNLIRRAKRRNPEAAVVVTGCYAAMRPEELRRMPEVDRVVTRAEQSTIFRLLGELAAARGAPGPEGTPTVPRRTRAIVKVQEGCDVFCSFCVIPYSRGSKPRSMPEEEVRRRLSALAAQGQREVVVTGPNVGGYGSDLSPPATLARLLAGIAALDLGLRIRVSSIQPTCVTDDLVEVLRSSPTFCRHLHIPLQSGDDGVLRRMNRPYRGRDYARLVESLAARIPGVGLGADVVVGHPGEDDAAFARTRDLLRDLPLSYLHVFPFSARPMTAAAAMADAAPAAAVKERCAELRAIDAAKRAAFARSQVGRRLEILLEGAAKEAPGYARGYADNYLPVLVSAAAGRRGSIVAVRVLEARARDAIGVPIAGESRC